MCMCEHTHTFSKNKTFKKLFSIIIDIIIQSTRHYCSSDMKVVFIQMTGITIRTYKDNHYYIIIIVLYRVN